MDLRRPTSGLLEADLWFRAGSGVARSRSARVGAASRLFIIVRFRKWVGVDQPPLCAELHQRHLARRLQLPGNGIRGEDAGRGEAVSARVGGSAPIDRRCDGPHSAIGDGDRGRPAGGAAASGDRCHSGGMCRGDRSDLPGRHVLSRRDVLAVPLQAFRRRAAGDGAGGAGGVFRGRSGQLHLSPVRPGHHAPARLRERRSTQDRSLLHVEQERRGRG